MKFSKQPLLITVGFVLVVVLVGMLTALTGNVAAQSAGIVVAPDGSENHTPIQNAMDNVDTDDRIRVSQGTYSEFIDLTKNEIL